MKPKMARFIDYWAGNVICLAVSSIYNLSKIFPRKKNPPPPKNILLLELSEMGSAILSYPAIKLIKDRYPDARIYFWIFDKNADGVRILGIIPDERIITTRSSCLRLLVWDTLMNIVKIRKAGIDTVIDMELFSRFSSILVSAAGACRRAGFHRFSLEGLYRADVYTHKVMYNPHVHISRNFINLVNSLGEEGRSWALPRRPMEEWPLRLPAPKTDYQAQKMLHNKLITGNNRSVKCETIVVMNPGLDDALSIRKWPIENYAGLARKLCADKNVAIVLIGKTRPSCPESQIIKDIFDRERVVNIIGKTDAGELLELFRIASLFISHDSGAVSFASLVNVETIVLFGPETPIIYAPLGPNTTVIYKRFACSPCLSAYNHRTPSCRDNKCVQSITVEEVYEKSKIHLRKSLKDTTTLYGKRSLSCTRCLHHEL